MQHNPTRSGPRSRAGRSVAIATILAPLALAACGGDSAGPSEEYKAFCDAELAVEAATLGEDPAAIEAAFTALATAAPDSDKAVVERTIAAAQEMLSSEGPPSEEFDAAYGALVQIVKDECGFEQLDTEAVDYTISGIGDDVKSGPNVVTFENKGSEYHEIAIVRRNDGVDMPAADLLMLPEEEAMSMVSFIGIAFAAPGTTGYTVVDLEPGSYIATCFIPTGFTQEAFDAMMTGGPEPDGLPHFMNGMITEFEVTD